MMLMVIVNDGECGGDGDTVRARLLEAACLMQAVICAALLGLGVNGGY